MKTTIKSILLIGVSGLVIDIECHLSNGLPAMVIVGLGNKAVDEAKDRIRSAFASRNIALPKQRITINLAPADIPKNSTSLDLSIAAAIMQTNNPAITFPSNTVLIGELSLNGTIRPVRGIIGILLAGKKAGICNYIIPRANMAQASHVPGLTLIPIASVDELTQPRTTLPIVNTEATPLPLISDTPSHGTSFSAVAGQEQAKRALEIAAAGAHNVLLYGPPGTGKSMLAKALSTILPPASHQEMLEITHLQSLASHNYDDLITTRPFRSPHNSATYAAILGGGDGRLPGEVALSHHGVLFLDELPEFSRTILEALRQPLEDDCITISRARYTIRYPTRFILVGTANPCPCGYYGTAKSCSCSAGQITRYQQRISGPIMDRIDLHVSVDGVAHRQILRQKISASADSAIRKRVVQARHRQHQRYQDPLMTNSRLATPKLRSIIQLHEDAQELLDKAAERLDISARSYVKLVKVARTIADLEGGKRITTDHISEALQYRRVALRP